MVIDSLDINNLISSIIMSI